VTVAPPELLCSECGRLIGTNEDCTACLRFLLERAAQDLDTDGARMVFEEAERWAQRRAHDPPDDLVERVRTTLRLLSDYLSGRYRKPPWATIAGLAAAVLYVVNPMDLITDFLPVVGWVDDASVLALVYAMFAHDLKKYRAWRRESESEELG
jgi:uncharacterized membrane protein YkvA (DUF1232 family)